MTELTPPRGTQDLVPDRADAMLGLYEEAHRLAWTFGFRYLETPTFEHTELFARTAGETSDVVTKEMYTFEDKGGRSVTLRPESTAGVMRAWLMRAQALGAPFRGYCVASEFRHGRPQAGRLREFRQFDVEIIGEPAPGADIEVIALGERFLRARGLRRYRLHLNSIGDEVCRPAYRDELIAHFRGHLEELDEDCRERLERNPLRVFDCKVDGRKDFVLAAPTIADRLCGPCAEHFARVRAGLDAAGIGYVHDPRLVRGLDYYTRTTFEWISDVLAESKAGTINAGGRYDGLAEALGGRPTAGVGFAMGLDRVLLAMDGEQAPLPPPRVPRAFVVTVGNGARAAGDSLLSELRTAGVPAIAAFEERPMKAQMKQADRSGATFAAIVGDQEVADGTITLRRLADGIQKTVPAADVTGWLLRLDDWTDAPS